VSIEDKEGILYELTLDSLIARLKSEDCSAADINAARQLMKEQGIQGGSAMASKEKTLAFSLPTFPKNTEEELTLDEFIA